jgi:CubicO group peptidase (beta-lactamase class C family)
MFRQSLRVAGSTVAGLAAVFLAALVASPYLRRWTLLNNVDVHDYDKLPGRTVKKSPRPFQFPSDSGGDWVKSRGISYKGRASADEADLGRYLEDHGTTAFIVIHRGRLLDERYFNGFRRDSLFKSFSVTKSVLSALIGAAIADGLIGSIDDPVTRYIPEMSHPRFARVTLRHCLDNTAGIKYERGVMPWKSQPRMYYTTDVRAFVQGVEVDVEPTTRFSNDDVSPLILGWALERALARHASIRTVSGYLEERIWQPIGAEYDALWNLDRQQGGLEKTESGLSARAIDLAKFAVLYLQAGRWGNTQVVPAEWVAESTAVEPGLRAPNVWSSGFHRRLWWGRCMRDQEPPDFYANGHFGQRLYASPRHKLVLVRMGESNSGIDWADFLGSIADRFTP